RFTCGVQPAQVAVFGSFPAGAKCWGTGTNGQVGFSSMSGSSYPEAVVDPPGRALDMVTAGGQHACAIDLTNNGHGDAFCWGDNTSSQLGNQGAPTHTSWIPWPVAGTRVYKQISAGRDHTCALSQYK